MYKNWKMPYLVILKNCNNMILDRDPDPESRIRISPKLQSTVPSPNAYPSQKVNEHSIAALVA